MRVGEFKFRAGGQKYWLKDGTLSGEPIEGVEPTEILAHVVFIWRDEQNRRVTTYVMEPCNSPGNPELAQQLVEQANQGARLTALLEDRQGMAVVVFQEMMHYSSENFLLRSVADFKAAERVADRLIAYLKPLG